MRSGVTAREKERAERATLVQQEKLSKAKVLPGVLATVLLQRCVITAAAPLHCKHLDFLSATSYCRLSSVQACQSAKVSAISRPQDMLATGAMVRDGICVCTSRGGSTR